jgi:hypothetical protein
MRAPVTGPGCRLPDYNEQLEYVFGCQLKRESIITDTVIHLDRELVSSFT